jgi:hypothetical protein
MSKLKKTSVFIVLIILLSALIFAIGTRRACGDVCVAAELVLSLKNTRKEIEDQLLKSAQITVNSTSLKPKAENYYLILATGTIIASRDSVTIVLEPKLVTGKVNWICYGNPTSVHSILRNSDCNETRQNQ